MIKGNRRSMGAECEAGTFHVSFIPCYASGIPFCLASPFQYISVYNVITSIEDRQGNEADEISESRSGAGVHGGAVFPSFI